MAREGRFLTCTARMARLPFGFAQGGEPAEPENLAYAPGVIALPER